MSNKTYDILKRVGRYVLPALSTMVIAICEIWGIKYGAQIGATIMALDTFLNVCLGISSAKYFDDSEPMEEE